MIVRSMHGLIIIEIEELQGVCLKGIARYAIISV